MIYLRGYGVVVAYFKSLYRYSYCGTEESHEKPQPGQPIWWPRLNQGPSEYEAGVPTTTPWRSVQGEPGTHPIAAAHSGPKRRQFLQEEAGILP
jgi:hypothetical protein